MTQSQQAGILRGISTSVAAVLATAGVGCAQAQTTAEPVEQPGNPEIIVTAQRRSESLQRTPIAVTALSPAALEERSVRSSQDLMQVVPSLQVSTQTAGDGGGSATFFLRGMGQQRSGNGSQPAVGIYIDDFYYPSLEGAVFNILDVQQVEVLRGPQGTLFGRNTIGGAIRYTTKKPDETLGGYVSATYGTFNRNDFTGALNVPLGDKAAIRLTAGRLDSDGYVLAANTGKKNGGSTTTLERGQLRIQPDSSLTIDVQGQHSLSKYDGFAYNLPGPFNKGQVSGIWNSIPPLGGVNPYDSRYTSACTYCQPGSNEFSRVASDVVNGVIAWDATPQLSVKSLTGYTHVSSTGFTDLDGTPLPVIGFSTAGRIRALSQEFQLNGHVLADRIKFVSGLYFYDSRSTDQTIGTVLAVVGAPTIIDRNITSEAAYIDLTAKVTDRLSVLGGYRYSSELQRAWSGPLSGRKVFGSGTGRIGLQMQWMPELMSYASVSQGFRGGGFNRLQDGTLQSFRPENSISYEIGSRLSLFDRRLRINPTFFYTSWKDIQVQRIQYILDANGNPTTTFLTLFDNAAKAHTYGLELEADAAVTRALHLFGHLATLEAHYDDVGNAFGISINTPLQRAPKFSYGVGGTYTLDLKRAGSLATTVNYSWQSSQASTPTDSDRLILPEYGLMNVRIDYRLPNKKTTISGFVTNLFDQAYYIGGVNYAESSPHYDLGRPREFGVSARVQY